MDLSVLFKATIKGVRSRLKSQGQLPDGDKDRIMSHSRHKTEFATKAKDVVNNITKLRDFLLEHRKEYISASSHLSSTLTRMSDAERDQIDADAQTFMKTCSEAIKVFKLEVFSNKVSAQVKEHRNGVFSMMEEYLKTVCKIYSEQRAIRVRRVVDKKRIARLEPNKRKSATLGKIEDFGKEKGDATKAERKSDLEKQAIGSTTSVDEEREKSKYLEEEDDDISQEEMQMFEQENKKLFEEMNSLVSEVRQIEGKVVEISRLQEIFADKILEQEKDIDRIAETTVGTTENVKEGNENIREAMKNNAGFRVWILFFLVVSSFSLLFLDWYND